MSKRLAFRQISAADVASSVVMTLVAPTLAWLGWGLWAIVAEQFSGIVTRFFIIQFIYRPWRLRFGWDRTLARWFWDYGKKAWGSTSIAFFLDQFDDWFTGTFLGSSALGYYSRAYQYARYPRRVIANPILSIFFPTFARLQEEKQRLSRAFFRPMSLMVRGGCLFALLLILTAPEFIPLILGEKWLPMLTTFQLLIVYTLFDPLGMGATNLLMATGRPQVVLRARVVQAIVFVPAVVLLGNWLGIEGVALAADLMILVGTILLFRHTLQVVDYSSWALWAWPLIAMVATGLLVLALAPVWEGINAWLSMGLKIVLISVVYGIILWLAEREQLKAGRRMIWGIIAPMLKERRQRNAHAS